MPTQAAADPSRQVRQALVVWAGFFLLNVVLNGTIPFVFGADMRAWTASTAKEILSPLLIYGGVFLVVPLILVKGPSAVRQPTFLLPLLLALIAIGFWHVLRGIGVLAILVLVYLHRRFDLSELGVRSRGWPGDLLAILLPGILVSLPALLQATPGTITPGRALLAGFDRLLANPASSVENLFYFGFVAERLSSRIGLWLTPIVVAMMYTAHELSNPEYWYEGLDFTFVFVGVVLLTVLYLWRRNVVAIWLGDGVRWMLGALL
jgi:membrane protease YdiL (CAAX protease family)